MTHWNNSCYHSERFKENSIFLFDLVKSEMDNMKNPPITPFISGIIRSFISNKNSHEIIENFIKETNINWDDIKSRDEEKLIETIPKAFLSKDNTPELAKPYIEKFLNFIKDRKDYVCENFDDDAWEIIDSMVKHSILYIHNRRAPNPKYTVDYFPTLSVKNHSLKWGVTL